MKTVDHCVIRAEPGKVWELAARVEQWPNILQHYRWVNRCEGAIAGDGVVEMAAWRPFGVFRWPTWWKSSMWVDSTAREIRYRHIAGITAGMDVLWSIVPLKNGWSDVTIVHEWSGLAWPMVGRAAANLVIGPVFVHGIASRTLAGIARAAEASQ